jgi:signal transduction histidine kinase
VASSGAAGRLLAREDVLLARWTARVREEVPPASAQPHPILVNTFPRFLRLLAEALHPGHPREGATSGTTLAQEHGGERVRLTDFRLQDVVREYQLLREVLLEGLEEGGPLTPWERGVILRAVDASLSEACAAYVLVSDGLREQLMLTLTHDLRSPLTAARAAASLVLRRPDSPDVPRWAARVVEAVDRVDGMVRDLLDVSRVGAGARLALELAPCEMGALVRGLVEQLEVVHGARFVVAAPPSPVHGHWSPDALRRALENLASNAVKYGDPHRPITFSVRARHERVVLTVHNHGRSIPLEEQGALFLAFKRSREAERGGQRGWGLGLALVRAVAEAHGGSVEVESLPERGTTFTLDVPQDARPYQQAPLTP